ncbi:hypothetical protein [Bradyrhizobium japonicum]|uniref:hypothetical protein n=1 Tax=Bradyrhizobium japonicum TaxID=375 RepID=UPI00090458E8|nr:hypothetical protein [Bradyrhizobium japonicum]
MSGEFVDMIEAKIAQTFKKQYAQLAPDEIMVLAFLHKRLAALKAAELNGMSPDRLPRARRRSPIEPITTSADSGC